MDVEKQITVDVAAAVAAAVTTAPLSGLSCCYSAAVEITAADLSAADAAADVAVAKTAVSG